MPRQLNSAEKTKMGFLKLKSIFFNAVVKVLPVLIDEVS